MHQVQIHIRRLKQIKTLLQTLLHTRMERAPQLACNEEVLPLHDAARNNILQRFANLVLVLVAERAVNVPVSTLDGVDHSLLDFSRRRLPRPEAEGGDRGAGV